MITSSFPLSDSAICGYGFFIGFTCTWNRPLVYDYCVCRFVTVKILNYYEEPVRFHLDLNMSDFQFCTQTDDKEKLCSSREIILPVSRTERDYYSVRIVYEPRQIGFSRSRLKANCPDRDIRFRVSYR